MMLSKHFTHLSLCFKELYFVFKERKKKGKKRQFLIPVLSFGKSLLAAKLTINFSYSHGERGSAVVSTSLLFLI